MEQSKNPDLIKESAPRSLEEVVEKDILEAEKEAEGKEGERDGRY